MSFLGIDLGTTGINCAAYGGDGRSLAKACMEHGLITSSPEIVEPDPNAVWEALCLNIKELNAREEIRKDPICTLGVFASGNEALLVDKSVNALYNIIMSMDKRGDRENDWVNSRIARERIYQIIYGAAILSSAST
ncbi:MAG: FGGY family carbohydrate kinase [Armatimonadota bacterium]